MCDGIHKGASVMIGGLQDKIAWFQTPLCRELAVFCTRTPCSSLAARDHYFIAPLFERKIPRRNYNINAHG